MKHINRTIRVLPAVCILLSAIQLPALAQYDAFSLKGKVLESSSGKPLSNAIVSVTSTGMFVVSEDDGSFELPMPGKGEEIRVMLPDYHSRTVFHNGNPEQDFYLTRLKFFSADELYNAPLGIYEVKHATEAVSLVTRQVFEGSATSSPDHVLQGRVPGLKVIRQSGMPGQRAWMTIRGMNSLYGRNEPLIFIDGMIHETHYPAEGIIEGHQFNPLDVVDIDDIVDISVLRSGETELGAAASNGLLFINTEQKLETSAAIHVRMYGGISLAPNTIEVLDAPAFRGYFTEMQQNQGLTQDLIDGMYPWLNGEAGSPEYYRYNNNTDWQKANFTQSSMQKYYIFIKGGDDIATYNISSGLLRHGGPFEDWRYNRYNLRLNGRVNITNKLSVTPNAKLSLSDSYLSNMGPTATTNPLLSGLLIPPLMSPYELSEIDGSVLPKLENVGVFNVSNPTAIISESLGRSNNYHFLSSAKVQYDFSPELSLSNLIGISYHKNQNKIFIPGRGLVQIDSARNSPRDYYTEFRSTQNHLVLSYKPSIGTGHKVEANAGMRFLRNSYESNSVIDLNTSSDEFRAVGNGGTYTYLRSSSGELREHTWLSLFANVQYNYRQRYYGGASVSYDGSSALNALNRYNVYPAINGGWRVSSEEFMSGINWLDDLRLRGSAGVTGNMFSRVYDNSKLLLSERKFRGDGVLIRDYLPNEKLKQEMKTTYNAGLDLSVMRQAINLHIDLYQSTVNNMLINQQLQHTFGFTEYFDNGGKYKTSGIELAADGRFYAGNAIITLGAAVARERSQVESLNFIDKSTKSIIHELHTGNMITEVNGPLLAFYGYKTKGIYTENSGVIGPKGVFLQTGDVIFEELDINNRIDANDMQVIGNPNPDFFGGFSAGVSIKRLSISTLFTYSVGNDVFNYVRYKTTAMDSYANQLVEVSSRSSSLSTGKLPRPQFGDPAGNNVFSDLWIEDGTYLRLKELTIEYSVNQLVGLRNVVTFYLTGSNLLTFTNYTGYDPEFIYLNSPYLVGIDYGKVPHTRSVILGIKLDL